MPRPRNGHQLYHRMQIARARQFLQAHATERVRLGAVARAAGAARFHFSHIYRAVTGETMIETVTRIRVELAAAWLCEEPQRPVTEIYRSAPADTPDADLVTELWLPIEEES